MTENHPARYDPEVWDSKFMPDFLVVKDYADNAPWLVKGKDEKTPNRQRMILQLEYGAKDEAFMKIVLRHAERMGLLYRFLGEFM